MNRPHSVLILSYYRYANGTDGTKLYSDDGGSIYAVAAPPKGEISQITKIDSQTLKLSIKNVLCSGYELYRSTGGSNFTLLKTVTQNGTGDSRIVTEGGPDNDDYVIWEDSGLTSGTYKYYVVPFMDTYGIKVTGIPSDSTQFTL